MLLKYVEDGPLSSRWAPTAPPGWPSSTSSAPRDEVVDHGYTW